MLSINVKDNESIDKALKRFKKKFDRAGIMREYRSRTYFQKPSIERRSEVIKAAYRQKMQNQAEEE
ncbi:MAG: 30S ribosomal protein S21 [Bernardetiaceae bacterium]|nr:30S ribosomal protein S21 [Bernardetiaceae bacterium]